ncbi:hypothetical protein HMPREF1062_01395 [Bacteroides cellulosilyticus CL02T12C19]|jgi:acyl carrier protein|uniref:Carrier domain-containing protein n=1 Tax=Bacteroides cellulosilyticus CL02T12C19 TaxID=997874 RepID=I8WB48_9BACE|nr:acyl carrier protein [Bacteroides cellulosilyticus]EIY35027.1 hypothetical protein HMPREF1062_01395 [Bacteroides cellulosilyticus CL02T12C19]
MELNDFIEKFAEQFEETENTIFTGNTNFKELDEWTSLTALSIIAMLDEEYNISLKSDDLLKSSTIEELFERINK